MVMSLCEGEKRGGTQQKTEIEATCWKAAHITHTQIDWLIWNVFLSFLSKSSTAKTERMTMHCSYSAAHVRDSFPFPPHSFRVHSYTLTVTHTHQLIHTPLYCKMTHIFFTQKRCCAKLCSQTKPPTRSVSVRRAQKVVWSLTYSCFWDGNFFDVVLKSDSNRYQERRVASLCNPTVGGGWGCRGMGWVLLWCEGE